LEKAPERIGDGLKWQRALVPLTAMLGLAVAVAAGWLLASSTAKQVQPKFSRLTYQQGYPSNVRFAKDGHTVVYADKGISCDAGLAWARTGIEIRFTAADMTTD
jgi:hypothetical protein